MAIQGVHDDVVAMLHAAAHAQGDGSCASCGASKPVPLMGRRTPAAILVQEVQALLQQALVARVSGLVLLDRSGDLIFADAGALAILTMRDGLWWAIDGLATGRGPETRRLRQMVSNSLCLSPTVSPIVRMQMLVTRASGRHPYLVRLVPTAPKTGRAWDEVACAVHIYDLGTVHLPDRGVLREVFGLTQREADLAIELVRTGGLGPAAAAAAMAYNTARNHLHGIFAKCCVATQAEAIRLLAALP